MAVGNAGNVGSYLVMTTCPTWTSLTVAGWFKYTANSGGGYPTWISPTPATLGHYSWIGYEKSSNSVKGYNLNGTFTPALATPSPGDWMYIAIVHNGSLQNCYVSLNNATANTANLTLGNETANSIWILQDSTATDSLFANVDHVRVWNTALTYAQLDLERTSPTAVQTANLYSDAPLANTSSLIDISGNAHPWLSVGTIVNGASDSPYLIFPSSTSGVFFVNMIGV